MRYVDGFAIAVASADKEKFIAYAKGFTSFFLDHGALRLMECWGEDVPHGQQTDFHRAVQAKDDETVVFSWIEWPDKATRDAAHASMGEAMKTDPRFEPERNPMPFDGRRMIFGGFVPVLDVRARGSE